MKLSKEARSRPWLFAVVVIVAVMHAKRDEFFLLRAYSRRPEIAFARPWALAVPVAPRVASVREQSCIRRIALRARRGLGTSSHRFERIVPPLRGRLTMDFSVLGARIGVCGRMRALRSRLPIDAIQSVDVSDILKRRGRD